MSIANRPEFADLHAAIVSDVNDALLIRTGDVGVPTGAAASLAPAPIATLPWTTTVEGVVQSVLTGFVLSLGDKATNFVLAHKTSIRRLVSEPVLEMMDRIIHGLEDVKAAEPGAFSFPPLPGSADA